MIRIEFMIQIILPTRPRFCQDIQIYKWVFCKKVREMLTNVEKEKMLTNVRHA